jgi:hypothetical protein
MKQVYIMMHGRKNIKILKTLFVLNCVFVCSAYDDTIQAEVVVFGLLVSLYIP